MGQTHKIHKVKHLNAVVLNIGTPGAPLDKLVDRNSCIKNFKVTQLNEGIALVCADGYDLVCH